MSDRVSVTTSKSWFSRIIESIKSVLVGLILFVAAFPILFWNEGRAVKTARSLEEGSGSVVSVSSDSIVPTNEGKLIHVSGPVSTDGPIADDEIGVQSNGIKLLRNVSMYQWVEEKKSETRKKLGGGEETVTTYEYTKEWKDEPVDSSSFQETSGHENPGGFPIESMTFTADPVRAGAFTLSEEQLGHLNDAKDLPLADDAELTIPESIQANARIDKGVIYAGNDPASPQLGDVRVAFQEVTPSTVSLVGVQTAGSFAPYQAEAGDTVLLVEEGNHTAPEMFKAAQDANKVLTWILRGGGFLAMLIGLFLVFRPIAVLGDVVPLFGSLLGAGVGLFAFLISVFLSLTTIAIAWITVRPLLGITLLVLAVGAAFWLIKTSRKKKIQAPPVMPVFTPPPPPPAPV